MTLKEISKFQFNSCPHISNTKKLLGRLKMAPRRGRDSQLLCYFTTRRFQANRRDFSFSQLKKKRPGLQDDFRTFRIERPGEEFFVYLAA